MASCSSSSSSQYPHPSMINVGNFVSVKLTTANYLMWEAQMLSLILSQNLQRFIDGQNEAPPQNITVQPHDGSELNAEIENPEYQAWTRTDWLLKGWIIGSLSEEILGQLVLLRDWKSYTARDLWTKLAIELAPHSDQKPEIQLEMDEMIAPHSDQKPEIQSPTDGNTKTGITEESVKVLVELMDAIARRERVSVLKNRIVSMSPGELVLQKQGLTALNVAAAVGNIQVAKLLVEKAPLLPYIKRPDDDFLHIHFAAKFGYREMTSYLMKVTKDNEEAKPFEDLSGARLLFLVTAAKIYGVSVKLEDLPDHHSGGEMDKGVQIIRGKIMSVPWIKDIRCTKLKHHQALQLVKYLCKHAKEIDDPEDYELFRLPFLLGAQYGNHKVVKEILNLDLKGKPFFFKDEEGHTAIHLAIMCRHEEVFNTLYQHYMARYDKKDVAKFTDNDGNNILHLAGNMVRQAQLDLVSGGVLQMQRELQWFKVVEKLVEPQYRNLKNNEGKTSLMIFNEEHEKLMTSESQWVQSMANSCTLAASLIATVVFAAAITIPGGNTSDGIPIFSTERAFIIFAISDALALFSSLCSVLSFLSILTSRYAIIDFLHSLPQRLIIGLITLFISVTSVIIAFSAALYMVFGQRKAWFLILVSTLASLPVTLFVLLQFPLLLNMINSTYGLSIFVKPSERSPPLD